MYAGCSSCSISPNFWIFIMIVRAVWGLELSCCKITLFRLTNAGYNVSKFHELIPVIENKGPYRLHDRLKKKKKERKKLPVNHTFKIPSDTQYYFGVETDFFNDDFGRLTGTKPVFWGVRIVATDPFFSTCNNSLDPWDYRLAYDRYPLYVQPVEMSNLLMH